MTIREALNIVDKLLPNVYDEEDKMKGLKDIESQIYREIILTHENPIEMTDFTDDSSELFAPSPYDNLYTSYVEAQIYFTQKEIPRYNNTMAVFNEEYREYANWYNRNVMPIIRKDIEEKIRRD